MIQRAQVVALVAAVAIGAAVTAGLVAGTREAPVHVGPTSLPATDLVDVYSAIVVNVAGEAPAASTSPRTISVSRTIRDTCLPRLDGKAPLAKPCGRTKVGQLRPDIEVALREALARQGVDAVFGEDGELSLHQVISEETGAPAADAQYRHASVTRFHFKRVDGRLRLQRTSPSRIVD